MNTNAVTQIAILTRDIHKTANRWAKFLGLEEPQIFESDGYDKTSAEYRNKPCEGRIYQVCFNFSNIQVELIQPIGDIPSIWRECLDRDGEGLHHISFAVKGMAANINACEEQGLPLLQKGEYVGGRYAYMDAAQDMKVILELLEND